MVSDSNSESQPTLSIVIPMYNEESGISLLAERVPPILQGITPDWEILCVNDGSKDGTLEALRQWHAREPRVKFISLSRNFGKEAALSAGLMNAHGKAVIPIDADLQDPPELIPELVEKWKEGYKVVLATRRTRDGDSPIKRISSRLFYRVIGMMAETQIPYDTGDFRLMDQQVVKVLRLLPERSRFMKGLFAWVGFKTTQVYFDRPSRAKGHASQSLGKLYHHAIDGIIAFSSVPLQAATFIGLFISVLAFFYGGWLLVRTMIFGVDVPGYASIMASVLFMGGIQLLSIGILGEYIGRVYNETKRRPIYIIEESTLKEESNHHHKNS